MFFLAQFKSNCKALFLAVEKCYADCIKCCSFCAYMCCCAENENKKKKKFATKAEMYFNFIFSPPRSCVYTCNLAKLASLET